MYTPISVGAKISVMFGLSLAMVASGAAWAEQDADVEQRLRNELVAVMTELVQGGSLDADSSLSVETPARRVADLGLLVDSAHAGADGLRVVGVTPGGFAERIGLRTGDRLVAVNGRSLDDSAGPATLRSYVDSLPDGSVLAFYVRRDGAMQTVSGAMRSVDLPPMRLTVGEGEPRPAAPAVGADDAAASGGCGRISDFDVAPRQQNLHGARIIAIDGRAPGPTNARSFRVDAGRHVVKGAEAIESRYISFGNRARHSGLSERQYRTITVDVAPDTTVLIAARLNEESRNDPSAYWDAVAWKEKREPCR